MHRTISIKDEQLWHDLKVACTKRKLTISTITEQLLRWRLQAWGDEQSKPPIPFPDPELIVTR